MCFNIVNKIAQEKRFITENRIENFSIDFIKGYNKRSFIALHVKRHYKKENE